MLNATTELFLSEYFLFKAVLGKCLENGEDLFRRLGRIFLIPEGEAAKLYRLAENDTARAITTEQDFMQHQRMQKYALLIGSENKSDALWEEVASIKGNAIVTAQSQKLIAGADMSRNVVYAALSAAATGGSVKALRIMGILQCEGIFLNKNEKLGVKTLSKAADWNDSVSALALLHYCRENREYNVARLRQEVENTPFEELYRAAAERYGAAEAEIAEVRLMDKAFGAGVIKRETYDPMYARVLNGKALNIKDKEKAIFSLSREQLCAISDLPLKLSRGGTAGLDEGRLQKVALKREDEIAAIVQALKSGDAAGLSCRPLCLCCGSKYILNMYARAIRSKSAGMHYEVIDVAELSEYDFEPTPNNIFVRSVDEDRNNCFLLFFSGVLSERKTEAVKGFLQSARRAKFHLNAPNITLNLSPVLPVCFCDEQNARWLKRYCDELDLREVSKGEFSAVVRDIAASVQKLYGVGAVTFEGELADVFADCDADTAEKLIDAAVRARRAKGAPVTLSRRDLQEYMRDDEPKIGFGGPSGGRGR